MKIGTSPRFESQDSPGHSFWATNRETGVVITVADKESKEIKSGRGGKRQNAGRPKGSQNKATVAIREIAQPYGKGAIEILAKLMVEADSDQAKIAAAKELLDRGYGKSTQVVDAKVTTRTLAEELAELNDSGPEGH